MRPPRTSQRAELSFLLVVFPVGLLPFDLLGLVQFLPLALVIPIVIVFLVLPLVP
jgi:hypothetical protein